jgi:hypothetical protein
MTFVFVSRNDASELPRMRICDLDTIVNELV